MKIPTTGKECPYFYGDYYRGRTFEECRLVGKSKIPWESKLCKACPVPGIVLANSCHHMILSGEILSILFGLKKKIKIEAYCTKTHQEVKNPYTGCNKCHPISDLFEEAE